MQVCRYDDQPASSLGSITTEPLRTVRIPRLRCWHAAHPHFVDDTVRNIDVSSSSYESHISDNNQQFTHVFSKKARLKPDIALHGNLFQSYRASLAIWDHTVLPATRHKWTRPGITPARQAGTQFTYPRGMEGWVDLGSPIAAWPGVEPTTARSQVRCPNHYATVKSDDYANCDW